MARYDFHSPRLFLDTPLERGALVRLDKPQANYLCNVLRLTSGDTLLVFNGRDGEWRAALDRTAKKAAALVILETTRGQDHPADLHYLFAPLKHARLDYMVQKAVELGVCRLQPVMTRHAQVARVNLERMRANAIEAAEQCGILTIPEIAPAQSFDRMLASFDPNRFLVFCDEDAQLHDPIAALSMLRSDTNAAPPLAMLVGPEGGFADEERAALLRRDKTIRLALGPRILRADTAAVAGLALIQSVLGDWRGKA